MIRTALRGLIFGGAVFGGVALAQVISTSVQLSQDPRGVFGVDTAQNLYIQNNRHVLYQPNAAAPPVLSSGAGCVVTANSTDANGQLTGCSGANGVVTFGQAFLTAPRCVVSSSNATNVALTVTTTTTAITITPNTAGAGTWNWSCGSVS